METTERAALGWWTWLLKSKTPYNWANTCNSDAKLSKGEISLKYFVSFWLSFAVIYGKKICTIVIAIKSSRANKKYVFRNATVPWYKGNIIYLFGMGLPDHIILATFPKSLMDNIMRGSSFSVLQVFNSVSWCLLHGVPVKTPTHIIDTTDELENVNVGETVLYYDECEYLVHETRRHVTLFREILNSNVLYNNVL